LNPSIFNPWACIITSLLACTCAALSFTCYADAREAGFRKDRSIANISKDNLETLSELIDLIEQKLLPPLSTSADLNTPTPLSTLIDAVKDELTSLRPTTTEEKQPFAKSMI
jgi:hypothetical protein